MPSTSKRTLVFWAAVHYLAYVIMQTLALFAETRRGMTLPDLILDAVPVNRSYDWVNSQFWLPTLLLSLLMLATWRPNACLTYLKVGSAVSVIRGLFIVSTTLGPPAGIVENTPEAMLHLTVEDFTLPFLLRQWFPLDIFWGGSDLSAIYLTQDLFFSGHTATTFLLVLVTMRERLWMSIFLLYHVITVIFLFVTHEHYSIDIFAAYFIVYAVFVFMKKRGWLPEADMLSENG